MAPYDENEPEWYELPEDAPPPSLELGKRNSSKKCSSLRNSVLPSTVDPSLIPTPSPRGYPTPTSINFFFIERE
jgi:hypothetical protein